LLRFDDEAGGALDGGELGGRDDWGGAGRCGFFCDDGAELSCELAGAVGAAAGLDREAFERAGFGVSGLRGRLATRFAPLRLRRLRAYLGLWPGPE